MKGKSWPNIMLKGTDETVTSLNNLTDDITVLSNDNANIQVTTEGQAIKIDSSQVKTNKTGIATNVTAIAKNTAKVGITPAQSAEIVDNTKKISYTDKAQVATNKSDFANRTLAQLGLSGYEKTGIFTPSGTTNLNTVKKNSTYNFNGASATGAPFTQWGYVTTYARSDDYATQVAYGMQSDLVFMRRWMITAWTPWMNKAGVVYDVNWSGGLTWGHAYVATKDMFLLTDFNAVNIDKGASCQFNTNFHGNSIGSTVYSPATAWTRNATNFVFIKKGWQFGVSTDAGSTANKQALGFYFGSNNPFGEEENPLVGKTAYLLDDNNCYQATEEINAFAMPTNYTLKNTLEHKEGFTQQLINKGKKDECWEYRTDLFPNNRNYCKWTDGVGYELDESKKTDVIDTVKCKVKGQTQTNIEELIWTDEGEEQEFTSTYEHMRFTDTTDAKNFITTLKTKTMEELIDLLNTQEIVI